MVEYGRVWWSVVEYGRVWWSMVEYGGVWQSIGGRVIQKSGAIQPDMEHLYTVPSILRLTPSPFRAFSFMATSTISSSVSPSFRYLLRSSRVHDA